jgi:hypothetical protein
MPAWLIWLLVIVGILAFNIVFFIISLVKRTIGATQSMEKLNLKIAEMRGKGRRIEQGMEQMADLSKNPDLNKLRKKMHKLFTELPNEFPKEK